MNISAAFTGAIPTRDDVLGSAIDHAAGHGVIVVAAAGNDRRVGGSPLVSHQWVIPVAAADAYGHPLACSNVGASIGHNGVSAPGSGITSLTPDGGYGAFGGSSAAAALVSGAIALAWSAAPTAPAERVRAAFSRSSGRPGMVPQPLDAVRIYSTSPDTQEVSMAGQPDDRAGRQQPAAAPQPPEQDQPGRRAGSRGRYGCQDSWIAGRSRMRLGGAIKLERADAEVRPR